MLTDAVRKYHTGGAKREFPWVLVGLAIPALQVVLLIGAVIASNLGH